MRKAKKIELRFRRDGGSKDIEVELLLQGEGWKEEFTLEAISDKGARFQVVMEAVQAALNIEDVPDYGEPTVAPGKG